MLRIGIAVVLSSLLVFGAAAERQTCANYWPSERLFARELNQLREDHGKERLRVDPELWRVARQHSREMAEQGFLVHSTAEELSKRVTDWQVLGENIGVASGEKDEMADVVERLLQAFYDSAEHRRIMLSGRWKHFAVGVVWRDDTMWVTILFERLEDPDTTLQMPICSR